MNFCSDNTTGAAPAIMAALAAANDGQTMPYGADPYTARLDAAFGELFETEVTVFPVGTGTAANALSLAATTPPFGAVICHRGAHIASSESGAPEFYTGGAKLFGIDGAHGKLTEDGVAAALATTDTGNVHQMPPRVLSLTELTERGTLYTLDEIATLAGMAHDHGLHVHMDGARFANAVAALGCAPAEATWRAGVDVLSFGATKNGAWAAEAVVVFKPELARELAHRRMRAGHLFSKMRFVAAQLLAYLDGDLWLRNAHHANAMAARLGAGLAEVPGVRLLHPVEGNQLFPLLPRPVLQGLLDGGFSFYQRGGDDAVEVRLVTAFNTREADIDAFVATARAAAT